MNNYIKRTIIQISALFLLSINVQLMAQGTQSIFDRMSHQEVLDVNITTDLEALSNPRNDKKQEATLSFKDEAGAKQVWDIKVSIRGKFRRMRCSQIPPLKIHFDKDDLREAGLTKFDDLKLVNQCMEDEVIGRELLLKEYLAYELYSNLTEESFRVQFLNITFKDSKSGQVILQPGFFIEDTAQLRERIGASKANQERGFSMDQFDQKQFQLMALFQYWIGNADWSVTFGRNIKVLEKDGRLIAIPYDFDFSGMVDAPYAIPNSNFGQTSIQERVYLGFESDVTELQASIEELVSKKGVLRKTVKKNKMLPWATRNETWNYLNSYFDDSNNIFFGIPAESQASQASSSPTKVAGGK